MSMKRRLLAVLAGVAIVSAAAVSLLPELDG